MTERKANVLFVCTGNAGRSQMAEALLRRSAGDRAEALSAGVAPWDALHPVGVRLMHERGVELSAQKPKHVKTVAERPLDLVVTIGEQALRDTPELPGPPRRLHWDLSDPADGQDVESAFRATLAQIERRMPDVVRIVTECRQPGELRRAPGISTCFVRPGMFEPAEHLPLVAEAGFKCIELNCYAGSSDFLYDHAHKVEELLKAVDETGVAVYSVHAPGGLLDLPGRGILAGRGALDMAKFFADLTVGLGAQVTVVHSVAVPGREAAAADASVRDCMLELQEHALPLPCVFGWENGWPGHPAGEHLAWVRDLNPGAFGFVLDTGHSNIDGNTDDYLPGCGLRLCGLHLNDNDARSDQHVIPGQGSLDWEGFMDKLDAAGYGGPMMLEVQPPGYEDDLPRLLREARQSIEFIRAGGRKE